MENYWLLHWELPAETFYRSSTLPHPACTLSVERGWVRDGVDALGGPVVVTGLLTSLTGINARSLRDVPVAPPSAISSETVDALGALGPNLTADACRELADSALDALHRAPDPEYDAVLEVISMMLSDRTLTRVGHVEERCGIGSRRLQRLFARYIGVGPKWVLARYRIHDVVSDLDAGYTGSLADLAARYGWFDQAHFTREFTELVGVSPSAYQS